MIASKAGWTRKKPRAHYIGVMSTMVNFMGSEKYQNYLSDLGSIVKEYALESIEDRQCSKGSPDEDFKTGYMMGLHRVVSLMQQQAESFAIPLK